MPDKTRYSRIAPAEIPAIIDKHFAVVKAIAIARMPKQ
jgi:hypothetical protein